MEHLYSISAGLGCFFIAILLSKTGKKKHDYILVIWLSLIVVHILVSYWQVDHPYTFLLEVSSALVYLHGPLLYLYILAVTSPTFSLQGKAWLHLLPFVGYLLFALPALIDGKLAAVPLVWRDILGYTKLGSIFIYSVLILEHRKKHLQQAQNTLSTLDAVQLKWIQYVIYGVLLVGATGLLSQLVVNSGWVHRVHEDLLVNISVSLLVSALGYYGIRQTPVFIAFPLPAEKEAVLVEATHQEGTEELTVAVKYMRSGLDASKSEALADSLTSFMEQKRPYTDPELSLGDLAEQLSLSPNHLSQIINEQFGKNFWDFVNEYRVKQVIADLKAGKHTKHTLLGIALDSGFNSKVSFNRAFKKFTGDTPTGFLKKL